MNDCHGFIPVLRKIVRRTMEIAPETRVLDVVEIFRKNKSLLAIPVVSDGKYSGVISRKELFFKWLSNKYSLDLFGNKPISILLEDGTMVMDPEMDVNRALQQLLAIDPNLEADCFPVNTGGACLGIVSVSDLMMEMSNTQSILLENLSSMSARIRDEVAQARRIQQDLLPPTGFIFKDVTLDAGVTTSTEVGGDFFDYFTVGKDLLGLIIADVSGHGVHAGMVTTAAKASLSTLISTGISTPAGLLSGINRAIIATTGQTLLMTCLVALLDVNRNRLFLANAGHNFPYLYQSGHEKLERLEMLSGFPLGLDAESEFREFSAAFEPGDALVLYTDGLIECVNANDECFGYERFEDMLLRHADLPPDRMRSTLMRHLAEFRGPRPFDDDVTLMVAVRTGIRD